LKTTSVSRFGNITPKLPQNGPVEVEYKYKRGYVHPGSKKKTLGELAKEAKKKVSD